MFSSDRYVAFFKALIYVSSFFSFVQLDYDQSRMQHMTSSKKKNNINVQSSLIQRRIQKITERTAVCRRGRRSWSKNNSRSLFDSVEVFFLISAEKKQEKNIGRGRRSPVRRTVGSASGLIVDAIYLHSLFSMFSYKHCQTIVLISKRERKEMIHF